MTTVLELAKNSDLQAAIGWYVTDLCKCFSLFHHQWNVTNKKDVMPQMNKM